MKAPMPDGASILAGDPKFAIRLTNEGVWVDALGVNVLQTFNL